MPSPGPDTAGPTEQQLLAELGRACLEWLRSPPSPEAKPYWRMRAVAERAARALAPDHE